MQPSLSSVSATDIKNRFGDYLAEAISKQSPVAIERHGKTVAVLVPWEVWIRSGAATSKPHLTWSAKCRRVTESIAKKRRLKRFSAVEAIRHVRDEEGE